MKRIRPLVLATALAVALAAPVAAFAAGADQLRQFMNATLSARGTFTQTVMSQGGKKPKQSAGIFAIERPGRFRWSYEKPQAQLLVSDGATLWSWDPDLNQVVVKRTGDVLAGTPAALLSGTDIERQFELADAGEKDGLEFVDATPKSKESSFARVRIGMAGNLPALMEIHDHFGQVTLLRFTRIEANPTLASELFRFKAPKGADVLGE